jgi:hypothetical protein
VDASVVNPVLDRLEPDGYKIMLEVLAKAPIQETAEKPITFDLRANGKSKLDHWEIFRTIRHMARCGYVARFADNERGDTDTTTVSD